jgi:hypothetical protein
MAETLVGLVAYLFLIGLLVGGLFLLMRYIEQEYPPSAPFLKFARLALLLLALVLIASKLVRTFNL